MINAFFHRLPCRRAFASQLLLLFGLLSASMQVLGNASTGSGDTANTITQLLRAMDRNAETLSYSGTLVYSQGDRMETLRRFHTVRDGRRHERLVHLSGKPRETIRRGDRVTCLASGEIPRVFEQRAVADTLSRAFAESLLSAGSAYRVELAGPTRVAGREAIQLRLLPEDRYRYQFLLALDKESKLLLQSLMLNEKRDVLERFEYLDIQIGEVFDLAHLEPTIAAPAVGDSQTAEKKLPMPQPRNWMVGWTPPGFMSQAGDTSALLSNKPQPRGGVTFGDGLSAFSVFVADSVNLGNQTLQRGATTAHTQVKKRGEKVYSVTVVGEIPALAAQKIADSVEFKH